MTVLVGSVAALALVLYGVIRFPLSLTNGGLVSLLSAVGGLAAYSAAALWSRRSSSADARTATRIGATIGTAIAIVAIVNHAVELWTTLPGSIGAVLGAGMWGLMFLGFGIACSITLARQLPFARGLLCSAWCAMVMAILLIVFALAVGFAFMPHMENVLSTPYAASGMTDTRAFVTQHLISSAASHLFIAPAIAVFVGAVSAAAFQLLASLGRRVAMLLGCAALLLLIAGAASLRHATSLARSERPPFIDFGLASLAVALVSAHPLVLAFRQRRRSTTVDARTV